MSFTKQNAAENKQMFARAIQLIRLSGYDPAKDYGRSGYSIPYVAYVKKNLAVEFPAVSKARLTTQAVKAKRTVYGEWVKRR